MPKNKSYTTEVCESTHMIAIHFEVLDDSAFQTPFAIENTNPLIPELFDMLYKKYNAEDNCNFKCLALFYELIEEIMQLLKTSEEGKLNPKIIKARQEIDKRFTDNNFNINTLADLLSVNSSYLRREFNKAYAISPISYLKKVRLQNAVSLLLSGYYSIEDIAKKCGYASASYFIQVFHKSKGCSPQKYKEIHINH